jgi:hypothetical protein
MEHRVEILESLEQELFCVMGIRCLLYASIHICTICYVLYIKCCNTWVSLQVQRFSQGLGTQTNNSAEYKGLLLGLKEASNQGYEHVHVRGDSQLVCKQVSYLTESMHCPILVYIWLRNLHLNEMNDDKRKNIIQLFPNITCCFEITSNYMVSTLDKTFSLSRIVYTYCVVIIMGGG